MKTLLSLLVLSLLSLPALAEVNYSKYCMKYLNGEMEGMADDSIPEDAPMKKLMKKNEMFEDFEIREGKLNIQGIEQPTIIFDIKDRANLREIETKFNRKTKKEIRIIKVNYPNDKRRSYTLRVVRDVTGKVLEVSRTKNALAPKAGTDVFPEKLTFDYHKNTCLPLEFKKTFIMRFNTKLCREIKEFFDANPEAAHCLAANYEGKLSEIVSKYDHKFAKKNNKAAVKALKGALFNQTMCELEGVSEIVNDDEFWKEESAPTSSTYSDADVGDVTIE